MNDLTILYYTANHIPEFFAVNVRNHLLRIVGDDVPIISISQKRIDFGSNFCVGEIQRCAYNVYYQILVGAYLVKTKWVACCEDDTLYSCEHFTVRPEAEDIFYYNKNRWILEGTGVFRWRDRTTMCACICSRDQLIISLENLFKKYPTADSAYGLPLGEPGRNEKNLKIPVQKLFYFKTDSPIVTFNHNYGLSRPRKGSPLDQYQTELTPFGDAKTLWEEIHGSKRFDSGKK